MRITSKDIRRATKELVLSNWDSEYKDFMEQFGEDIGDQEREAPLLEVADKYADMKNHIFYHMMILRDFYDF